MSTESRQEELIRKGKYYERIKKIFLISAFGALIAHVVDVLGGAGWLQFALGLSGILVGFYIYNPTNYG